MAVDYVLCLFVFAGYTYGPLLGMFAFGILTKWSVPRYAPAVVSILSPFIAYAISYSSEVWFDFKFGFFVLILNGAITFLGLLLFSLSINKPKSSQHYKTNLVS